MHNGYVHVHYSLFRDGLFLCGHVRINSAQCVERRFKGKTSIQGRSDNMSILFEGS